MNKEFTKTDIEQIAERGTKIYDEVKKKYEPKENGKFLAIDVDSRDTYLGVTSSEAVERARQDHPDKIFYVVKIGFSAAEMLARLNMNRA